MKQIIILFFLALLILPIRLFGIEDSTGIVGWSSLGEGMNGEVNALAIYNGNIYAGGYFSSAGGINTNNIAVWNGSIWQSVLNGVNDTVHALVVYNNELIVGGNFSSANGVPNTNNIAKWNGSYWSALGNGINGEVRSLIVYNNELIAGGKFNNVGENIAKWNGSTWSQLGSGVDKHVLALTIYNNELIAAGRFDIAGGLSVSKIAKWNGITWSGLSNSIFNERIHAVSVYNDSLIAGGIFTEAMGVNAKYLAKFNGTTWEKIGNGVEDRIFAIIPYKSNLIIGGQLKFAYNLSNDSVYVNRVARWNGSTWSGLTTGMNSKVKAFAISVDTSLIAGGEFTTAGGRYANRIAIWNVNQTYSIAGVITYNTTGLHVNGGYVKAIRLDMNTREVLILDSTGINPTNGSYLLNNVRSDSVDIVAFPNDISENDFVPTYHPATIYWENATTVNLVQNMNDINISVYKAESERILGSIGGDAILNFLPAGLLNGSGLQFKADAIIYAKVGNTFKNFSISSSLEQYNITSLPPGNYKIIANRLGYTSDSITVTLTSGINIDTVNFVLDTLNNSVGIQNINTNILNDYFLSQNFPNPYNPVTNIEFVIPKLGFIKLKIYDLLGREIAVLVNEELVPGHYRIDFNGSNLTSGIYFYRLEAGSFTVTKKMVLIK